MYQCNQIERDWLYSLNPYSTKIVDSYITTNRMGMMRGDVHGHNVPFYDYAKHMNNLDMMKHRMSN